MDGAEVSTTILRRGCCRGCCCRCTEDIERPRGYSLLSREGPRREDSKDARRTGWSWRIGSIRSEEVSSSEESPKLAVSNASERSDDLLNHSGTWVACETEGGDRVAGTIGRWWKSCSESTCSACRIRVDCRVSSRLYVRRRGRDSCRFRREGCVPKRQEDRSSTNAKHSQTGNSRADRIHSNAYTRLQESIPQDSSTHSNLNDMTVSLFPQLFHSKEKKKKKRVIGFYLWHWRKNNNNKYIPCSFWYRFIHKSTEFSTGAHNVELFRVEGRGI